MGLDGKLKPGMTVKGTITFADGRTEAVSFKSRIDTVDELDYYRNGGILQYVLRNIAEAA